MAVEIPANLRTFVRSRRAVAFIGAGFSAPVFPVWPTLIADVHRRAAEESNIRLPNLRSVKDPTMAISLLRTALDQAMGTLNATIWIRRALSSIFSSDEYTRKTRFLAEGKPNGGDYAGPAFTRLFQRCELLLETQWLGIVTTNIDDIIEKHAARRSMRLWGPFSPLRIFDSSAIGTLLNGPWEDVTPSYDDPWLIHLHGSVGKDDAVLSAEDYEDFYSTERTEGFLTALLLTTCCVFLGCSLDDEILRVRRFLNRRFGKLPPIFGFLDASEANEDRKEYLERVVGITVILYDNPMGDHRGFDDVLEELAKCQQSKGGQVLENIRNMRPDQQSEILDSVNIALLQLIRDQHDRLTHSQLISPSRHNINLAAELGGISANERYYRMAFLVHVQLVSESSDGTSVVYCLTERADEVLHHALVGVGG